MPRAVLVNEPELLTKPFGNAGGSTKADAAALAAAAICTGGDRGARIIAAIRHAPRTALTSTDLGAGPPPMMKGASGDRLSSGSKKKARGSARQRPRLVRHLRRPDGPSGQLLRHAGVVLDPGSAASCRSSPARCATRSACSRNSRFAGVLETDGVPMQGKVKSKKQRRAGPDQQHAASGGRRRLGQRRLARQGRSRIRAGVGLAAPGAAGHAGDLGDLQERRVRGNPGRAQSRTHRSGWPADVSGRLGDSLRAHPEADRQARRAAALDRAAGQHRRPHRRRRLSPTEPTIDGFDLSVNRANAVRQILKREGLSVEPGAVGRRQGRRRAAVSRCADARRQPPGDHQPDARKSAAAAGADAVGRIATACL